jgi:deoxyuridine 5'-triphosphate nucleotidohydrolase
MLHTILILIGVWIYFRYFGPLFITFKRVNDLFKKPTKTYGKAACWDVYAFEARVIPVGQWREVPLGISIAPWPHIYISFLNITITPFGNIACKIHTRSGLAIKKGLRNHLGIIDNDYRKELTAVVFNNGSYPVQIKVGDKIAQLEFYKVPTTCLIERKTFSKSERGEKGFGSSGK